MKNSALFQEKKIKLRFRKNTSTIFFQKLLQNQSYNYNQTWHKAFWVKWIKVCSNGGQHLLWSQFEPTLFCFVPNQSNFEFFMLKSKIYCSNCLAIWVSYIMSRIIELQSVGNENSLNGWCYFHQMLLHFIKTIKYNYILQLYFLHLNYPENAK